MTPIELYNKCFEILRTEADQHGYCLTAHGSMKVRLNEPSDLDLIAIPWKKRVTPRREFVICLKVTLEDFCFAGLGPTSLVRWDEDGSIGVLKPHGRRAWGIYVSSDLYIDLSVMEPRN